MKETDHPWITVAFDKKSFRLSYASDNGEKWKKTYQWNKIIKVCFKSYDFGVPNFAYIFFKDDPEPCIVPIDDKGGEAFWTELKRRGLFDASREIHADTSEIKYNCWPDNP